MKELKEIHRIVKDLKKESEEKSRLIEAMKNEKGVLSEKQRALVDRLDEASRAYSEAGKKLTEFVESQLTPIKKKMDYFDDNFSEVKIQQKELLDALKKIADFENTIAGMRAEIFRNGKNQNKVEGIASQLQKQDDLMLKRIARVESVKSDEDRINERLQEFKTEVDERLEAFAKMMGDSKVDARKELNGMKSDYERMTSIVRKDFERSDAEKENLIKVVISRAEKNFDDRFRAISQDLEKKMALSDRKMNYSCSNITGITNSIKDEMQKHKAVNDRDINSLAKNVEDRVRNHMGVFASNFDRKVEILDKKVADMGAGFTRTANSLKNEIDKERSLSDKELNVVTKNVEERIKGNLGAMSSNLERKMELTDKRISDMGSSFSRATNSLKNDIEKERTLSDKELNVVSKSVEERIKGNLGSMSSSFDKKVGILDEKITDLASGFSRTANSLKSEIEKERSLSDKELNVVSKSVEERIKGNLGAMSSNFGKKVEIIDKRISDLANGFARTSNILKNEIEKERSLSDKEMNVVSKNVEEKLKDRLVVMSTNFEKRNEILDKKISDIASGFARTANTLKSEIEKERSLSDKELNIVSKNVEERMKGNLGAMSSNFGKRDDALDKKISDLANGFARTANSLKNEIEKERSLSDKELNIVSKNVEERIKGNLGAMSSNFGKKVEIIDKRISDLANGFARTSNILKNEIEKERSLSDKEMNVVSKNVEEKLKDRLVVMSTNFEKRNEIIDKKISDLAIGFARTANSLKNEIEKEHTLSDKELNVVSKSVEERMKGNLGAISSNFQKKDEMLDKKISDLASGFARTANTLRNEIEKERSLSDKELNIVSKNVEERLRGNLGVLSSSLEKKTEILDKKISDLANGFVRTANTLRNEIEKERSLSDKELNVVSKNVEEKLKDKLTAVSSGFDKKIGIIDRNMESMAGSFAKTTNSLKNEIEKDKTFSDRELNVVSKNVEDRVRNHLGLFASSFDEKLKSVYDDMNLLKKEIGSVGEILDRRIDKGEGKRQQEMERMLREFMAVRGKAESDLKSLNKEIELFSGKGEAVKKEIIGSSLREFEKMTKSNELKLSEFRSNVNRVMDGFRTEMEKIKSASEKHVTGLSSKNEEAVRKRMTELMTDFNNKFAIVNRMLEGFRGEVEKEKTKMDRMVSSAALEIDSRLKKRIVEISGLVEGKLKDVYSDMGDLKKEESAADVAITRKIEQADGRRQQEIDRMAKEIMVLKGEMSEKTRDIDKEISRFVKMREEIAKEMADFSIVTKKDLEKSVNAILSQFEAKASEMNKRMEIKLRKVYEDVKKVSSEKSVSKQEQETLDRLLRKVEK